MITNCDGAPVGLYVEFSNLNSCAESTIAQKGYRIYGFIVQSRRRRSALAARLVGNLTASRRLTGASVFANTQGTDLDG